MDIINRIVRKIHATKINYILPIVLEIMFKDIKFFLYKYIIIRFSFK